MAVLMRRSLNAVADQVENLCDFVFVLLLHPAPAPPLCSTLSMPHEQSVWQAPPSPEVRFVAKNSWFSFGFVGSLLWRLLERSPSKDLDSFLCSSFLFNPAAADEFCCSSVQVRLEPDSCSVWCCFTVFVAPSFCCLSMMWKEAAVSHSWHEWVVTNKCKHFIVKKIIKM